MKRLVVNNITHVSSLGIHVFNLSTASWIRSEVFYFCFWDGKRLDLSLYFTAPKYFKTPRKVLKTKDIFAANIYQSSSFIVYIHIILCIYFCLCWVFAAACGLSLVAASGSGLLIVVVSLVVEHGLWARGLSSCGTWALEHRLSSCGARA